MRVRREEKEIKKIIRFFLVAAAMSLAACARDQITPLANRTRPCFSISGTFILKRYLAMSDSPFLVRLPESHSFHSSYSGGDIESPRLIHSCPPPSSLLFPTLNTHSYRLFRSYVLVSLCMRPSTFFTIKQSIGQWPSKPPQRKFATQSPSINPPYLFSTLAWQLSLSYKEHA